MAKCRPVPGRRAQRAGIVHDEARRKPASSLPRCNENRSNCIFAMLHAQITFFSRRIHSEHAPSTATIRSTESGNSADSVLSKGKDMTKGLLGAATIAAIVAIGVPAHAAKMSAGCSSANLEKTETMIENMADGDGKLSAQKEIALAQDSMLNGKMGACGMHLSKAMHTGMGK
jgi:hypothetical protein